MTNKEVSGEVENMDNLKPCPFCGTVPKTEVQVTQMGGGEDRVAFSVCCAECGINKTAILVINRSSSFFDVEDAMERAVEAWNRRAKE